MVNKKFKLDASEIRPLVPNLGACYASDMITVHGMKVGYMYREPPENEGDSGWRFFSGAETGEYTEDANNFEIYDVNTICNYDPDIISHLDAPPNSAFERIEDGFNEIEFEGG